MDAEQALGVRPNRPRLEQPTLTSSTPGGLCQSRHSSSAGLTCASREIRSTRPAERPSNPHDLRSEGVLPRVIEGGWAYFEFTRLFGAARRAARGGGFV